MTNIPEQPGHAFRAMGQGGMDDLMATGIARNNPASTFAHQPLYASGGAPLDRYTTNRAGGSHVLEFQPSDTATAGKGAAIRETQLPNRYFDPVRVWERTSPGEYRVAYDNINPVNRGLRTVGAGYLAPAALMAIPEATAKGMLRMVGGKPTNAADFLTDFGSSVSAGIIPDAGPVPTFKYGDEGDWTPKGAK